MVRVKLEVYSVVMNLVQIAYIHPNQVGHNFHHSMMCLTMEDYPSYKLTRFNMAARGATLTLPEARNELMRRFLDETDATHLFMIDTDMGFATDTIHRLITTELDVIGALCYGQATIENDNLGGYKTKPFVVAYDMNKIVPNSDEDEQNGTVYYSVKEDLDVSIDEPQQVAATGTGAILISRAAGQRVHAAFGPRWFDQVGYPTTGPTSIIRLSEDLSFCYRLSCVGIPIHVHTGVRTNHMKSCWI